MSTHEQQAASAAPVEVCRASRKQFPGVGERRRLLHPERRRDPRPARRERLRQVHADQDAVRRAAAGRRRRSCTRASRSTLRRPGRGAAGRASPPSTRSSRWSRPDGRREHLPGPASAATRRVAGRLDAVDADAAELLGELGLDIDPATRSSAICRSPSSSWSRSPRRSSQDANVLILDEPTDRARPAGDRDLLHRLLRRLKSRGVAILYISHRLDEVVELVGLASPSSRTGRVVSGAGEHAGRVDEIVCSDGRPRVERALSQAAQRRPSEVLLEVDGLATAQPACRDASFDVRRGEVVGLGGVLGSGRTEIARALFGADPCDRGDPSSRRKRSRLRGTESTPSRPASRWCPENRKSDGLVLQLRRGPRTSRIATLGRRSSGLFFDLASESERSPRADRATSDHARRRSDQQVGELSGGNQQKVVIARWLFADTGCSSSTSRRRASTSARSSRSTG